MPQFPTAPHPQVNRLLGALPPEDLEAILPHLTVMALSVKQMVYEVDKPITQVYFPLSGVFSMLAMADEGECIEVGTIGSEGMVGLPIFLGATTAPTLSFSQVPGYAACMEAEVFKNEVRRRPAFHQLMHRYTQALFNQIAQGSACNRHHEMRLRLARWLLMTQDRAGAESFPLTQEFMAQMLGVRRATASEAAKELQEAGLISYQHGMITIVDRAGLEAAACSCYRIIVEDFEKLIPRNPTMRANPAEPWGNLTPIIEEDLDD